MVFDDANLCHHSRGKPLESFVLIDIDVDSGEYFYFGAIGDPGRAIQNCEKQAGVDSNSFP